MGNTTTTNNKKKKSNARKLIPAIGMLMTSAAMLTTSTYAWFTMNKEVSITGISLTATVPETLEISIGDNTGDAKPTQDSQNHLITVPTPDTDDDWSNTVDIKKYYVDKGAVTFGKLYPASSVNGAALYQTKQASGQGLEYESGAAFDTAVELVDGTIDRYYLDIPVWFRTTSKSDVNLSVEAEIAKVVSNADENSVLYKAARVSIIDAASNTDGAPAPAADKTKIIVPKYDGSQETADIFKAQYNFTGKAVNGTGNAAINADLDNRIAPPLGDVQLLGSSDTVVSVGAAEETARVGAVTKKYIRIWLEGEDKNCFNPNAGQSFSIGLKFSKIENNS